MSTQDHDDLELLLGRELHDRAGDMHGAPFGLGEVKGRAGRIRRNRRIAAGVGVAAALAVIVPVSITAGGALNRGSDIPPADTTPTPAKVVETTLTFEGLKPGDAPAVEYFTADGVVLPDAGPVEQDTRWQALVPSPADGGWLAYGPAMDEVRYLTEDFGPQGGSSAGTAFITDPGRSYAAWTAREAGAQTLLLHSTSTPGDGDAWDFPGTPAVEPVDFAGEGTLVFQTTDSQGQHPLIGLATPGGGTTELEGDFVQAVAASPATGLVAVQTKANEDASGCFGVVDSAANIGDPVWETCEFSLGAFSPDGRYLLASAAYRSGYGLPSLAVLDAATGNVVTRFDPRPAGQVALLRPVWETPDTIVAVATEGTLNTVLRFGVDGTLERAVESVEVDDAFGDLAFHLGADRGRGGF